MPVQQSFFRRGVLAGGVLALAACVSQPPADVPPASVVFFEAFSANLEGKAQSVIADFAKQARERPRSTVLVKGYADKLGSTDANKQLSALRAQVVADALEEQGISKARISKISRGPTEADPGIESRRVDIELGR